MNEKQKERQIKLDTWSINNLEELAQINEFTIVNWNNLEELAQKRLVKLDTGFLYSIFFYYC